MEGKVERAASTSLIDPADVPGWGVDADPQNDPTYPMRDRSGDDSPGMNWTRPPLQPPRVEILRSIEHNRLPATLGTSTPPKGLSGGVRRYAFRFSESQWAHWLLLMLADRINVVEGLADDVRRGRLPDLLAETGLGRDLKRNPQRAAATLALGAAAVVVGVALVRGLERRNTRRW
jgi:hypothetical protein